MDNIIKYNPKEADSTKKPVSEFEFDLNPDMEKLRAYTKTKLMLAGQLRIVRESLEALGRKNAEQQCNELMVKLAEDRFTLAVLGQFKRGKSSLMNAIIGRELLPTGLLPLTSAITMLKYGPEDKLIINHFESPFPEELPVSSLAGFVTENGNPGNRRKVKTAIVELPVPFLRRGIEFVDTPGIGSAITANTTTTYSFLPECDAVLFVTGVDSPMTSAELEFLKEIQEYVNKIFFVVNKADLVNSNELGEILDYVAATIREQSGSGKLKIFPVSARLGLEARMSGDAVLYSQSGLKALEEALGSFLSGEKLNAFLAAVAQKALRIIENEEADGAFTEENLLQRTIKIQEEKTVKFQPDPFEVVSALNEARTKLETWYNHIVSGEETIETGAEISFSTSIENRTERKIEVSQAPGEAIDIEADLQSRECPVCRHLAKYSYDFFSHWQYELGTKEQAQEEFAEEQGFCPLHTWQLLAVSSPHGASVGFARLTERVSQLLRAEDGVKNTLHLLTEGSGECRVCRKIELAESEYVRKLAGFIIEKDGREKYIRSQGVCLKHLEKLLKAIESEHIRKMLVSHASQRFDEDAEDMRAFALKSDALRRALQNRDEKDAHVRAIARLVGSRALAVPWPKDGEI
jgi:hypothetical protein